MSIYSVSRTLPYSCEQLFDLAADVESYPEYMPGWINARILQRSGNRLRVEQQLGLKLLPHPFISNAILDRPHKVTICSNDGPFRSLQIEWRFAADAPGYCKVSLRFNYELHNTVLERLAAALINRTSAEIITRFNGRAQLRYGK